MKLLAELIQNKFSQYPSNTLHSNSLSALSDLSGKKINECYFQIKSSGYPIPATGHRYINQARRAPQNKFSQCPSNTLHSSALSDLSGETKKVNARK